MQSLSLGPLPDWKYFQNGARRSSACVRAIYGIYTVSTTNTLCTLIQRTILHYLSSFQRNISIGGQLIWWIWASIARKLPPIGRVNQSMPMRWWLRAAAVGWRTLFSSEETDSCWCSKKTYASALQVSYTFYSGTPINKCSRSIINMGGQFQSNSTDLFSTAAAVTRRYGSAAGFTCVYLCSTIIPRLHYQPVSSRFSWCAWTSPVSTSVCVYITTARTGLNRRQLVRLFQSTVAGSRAVLKHVRACR